MDDASPVAEFQVGREEVVERFHWNAISLDWLNSLGILLTFLAIIEFVHAEDEMPLDGEGGDDFVALSHPVVTHHALLQEPGVTTEAALLENHLTLVEMAGGKMFGE